MAAAIYTDRHEQSDTTVDITAWQTSLLMNATGNFKKKITPDMLLNKGGDKKEGDGAASPEVRKLDKEEKEQAVKELLAKFT